MTKKNLTKLSFFVFLRCFSLLVVLSSITKSILIAQEKLDQNLKNHPLNEDKIFEVALDLYLYAYPLVSVVVTKNIMTNVEILDQAKAAPINQIFHARDFPDHNFRDIVRPNVDTYYSNAFINLAQEPFLFEIPDTEDRYYLIQFMDAYTKVFASLGKRTTGTKAQKYVVVGPTWTGSVPADFELLQASTNLIWMINRIQVDDPKKENKKIWALQNQFQLKPLSSLGKIYEPKQGRIDSLYFDKSPKEYINAMDLSTFFSIFTQALVEIAPIIEDETIKEKLDFLGIKAGQNFEINRFSIVLQEKFKKLPSLVQDSLDHLNTTRTLKNGWQMTDPELGVYNRNYEFRAMVAYHGLGANIVQDAIYPTAILDDQNKILNSEKKYILHFSADEIPKVKAFWSLTVYDAEGFLVKNKLNRFALSDRDPLKYNKDGSVDLYIQRKAPTKNKQNWLPTAENGNFTITLRAYWPDSTLLEENWTLPVIKNIP